MKTAGFAGLFSALLAYPRRGYARLRKLWRRDRFPFVFGLVLALGVALVTMGTYLLEHRINEHFSTLGESFWSITVYLFSGLEDRSPKTDAGRLVATLGLLLGPVLFAVVTG